jgi:hypothetical protein
MAFVYHANAFSSRHTVDNLKAKGVNAEGDEKKKKETRKVSILPQRITLCCLLLVLKAGRAEARP